MKALINLRIKLHVFCHYFFLMLKGDLEAGYLIPLLARLNLFISKLQHNKFGRIGSQIRLDLYVPSYPGKAFFTACDKFRTFGGKTPSTGALLSVTSACAFECEHCYQRMDKGSDMDLDLLVDTARQLQEMGVCFFNIEGGEPFLRFDRLKAVCDVIDERSEIWINSTGYGMTEEKLRQIRPYAVMFSLHSTEPSQLNRFMGRDYAWEALLNGIRVCKASGVPFAFNTCLMEEAFSDGGFEQVMEFAREQGACLVQVIKPKPAGAWLGDTASMFTPQGMEKATRKVHDFNLKPAYRSFPPVSAQIIEELPEVFGCTAGGTDRFYINAKGDVQPCEFLNISFGNLAAEDFRTIYERMRTCFRHPGTCMLCEQQAGKIHRLYREHNLDRLPLPAELSRQVYDNWDRGEVTELYQKLKEQ